MATINIQPDCGNAPRKLFLKEFNVALATGDMKYLVENIQDSIHWEVVGDEKVIGKGDYLKAIVEHKLWRVRNLTIETIITHGRDASVSGHITTTHNTRFDYCDIYRFSGASGLMINSIKTFLIHATHSMR